MRFLKDEGGHTSTEYILLGAVVALIVLKFKDVATVQLTSLTESIFGTASSKITAELQAN